MKILFKNNTLRLTGLLIFFVLFWFFTAKSGKTVLWLIFIAIISIIIIIRKYSNIKKIDIIIGIILSITSMISSISMGILVLPAYLASISIFKETKQKIVFYHNTKRYNLLTTLILVFVIGGILAIFNILLGLSNMSITPSLNIKWLYDSLRAGIVEEICFRMFFFAICMIILKNTIPNRAQNILTYLIMVIPHVLIHFNINSLNINSLIILTMLFGLPFAIMQRKYNLISAIGSHAFVDFIRFCIFGA